MCNMLFVGVVALLMSTAISRECMQCTDGNITLPNGTVWQDAKIMDEGIDGLMFHMNQPESLCSNQNKPEKCIDKGMCCK